MAQPFTDLLATEYQVLFNTSIINPDKAGEIDHDIDIMLANRSKYDAIANEVNVPWYFVSIVHCMEGSLNFNTHLHNGDPLTARTVNVPVGRPTTGNPPFSFIDSAIDALKFDHLVPLLDTSIPGLLFAFERYNGFGSRAHGINSPYLWSFSNHYTKGKFVKDGVFDPEAISRQAGAAVLLRRIMERQITLGESDIITQIKQLGEQVTFDPNHVNDKALQLQKLLNTIGLHLKQDGKAGNRTSNAYQQVSGKFLNGDSRRI
jgi:lysozyme family protein